MEPTPCSVCSDCEGAEPQSRFLGVTGFLGTSVQIFDIPCNYSLATEVGRIPVRSTLSP